MILASDTGEIDSERSRKRIFSTDSYAVFKKEKIIKQDENFIVLEFSLPGSHPYFDGHFPEFPILPAIAQTELVIRFSSFYLGTGIDVCEIPRIKYTNFIKPFAPLVLEIKKNKENISFKMLSPDGAITYSTGIIKFRTGSL